MENIENYNEIFQYFQKNFSKEILQIGKILGKGAFGEVREIIYRNKTLAGKLIEKETNELSEEGRISKELYDPNIIRIYKIYSKKINGKYYDLILMEKALLNNLGKLNNFIHLFNILKLIYINPFDEIVGNNLLRFYAKQIISALKTLDINNYVHFDIKPENFLITNNLLLVQLYFS